MTAKTVGIGYRIQEYMLRMGGHGIGQVQFPRVDGMRKPTNGLVWVTLGILCQHANEKMGWPEARPSVELLMAETNLSDKTVGVHLTYLEALGVISVVGRWSPKAGSKGRRIETLERSRGNVQTIWRIHEDVLDSYCSPRSGSVVKLAEPSCGELEPPRSDYVDEPDPPRSGFPSTPKPLPGRPRSDYVGTPLVTPLGTPPPQTDFRERPFPQHVEDEETSSRILQAIEKHIDKTISQRSPTLPIGDAKNWRDTVKRNLIKDQGDTFTELATQWNRYGAPLTPTDIATETRRKQEGQPPTPGITRNQNTPDDPTPTPSHNPDPGTEIADARQALTKAGAK